MSQTCPDPSCQFEIGDTDRLRTFIEVGDHADEDHGDELTFTRGPDGWVLRYDPDNSKQEQQ